MSKYCERYDVTYNDFGEYLEDKCNDSNCEFCTTRPRHLSTACKICTITECPGLRPKKK